MTSLVDFDSKLKKFINKKPKESVLEIWKKDLSEMIGTAEFDMARYANDDKAEFDSLPVKDCKFDQNAFIEIKVQAKLEIALTG